jgi:ubiquinone/menaquinone biosynthesis C-methylase UbiE
LATATSTQWQLAREAAERYRTILEPAILGPFAQVLVEWSKLGPGQTVVDVGCGTGAATRYAATQLGPSGRVIGVDINRSMIEVALSRPPVTGAPIEWYQESAYQLPLHDQSVDVALCAQTLQFLNDRRQALAEMRRVLKPGGRIVLSLWRPLAENPYFQALVTAISEHIGPETAVGLQAVFALTDAAEIRALLAGANFQKVEIGLGQLELELPPLLEFIPRHISATPMAAAFSAAAPAVQQAVIADVARQLAPFQSRDGVRVPFRSHLAQAAV